MQWVTAMWRAGSSQTKETDAQSFLWLHLCHFSRYVTCPVLTCPDLWAVCNVFHHTNDTACTQGGWKIINEAQNLKEQSAKPGMIPRGLKGSNREINSVGAVTCRCKIHKMLPKEHFYVSALKKTSQYYDMVSPYSSPVNLNWHIQQSSFGATVTVSNDIVKMSLAITWCCDLCNMTCRHAEQGVQG